LEVEKASIEQPLIGDKKLSANIFVSSLYKATAITANLLLVRVCVNYMGEEKYGVWLTLLSFLTWFSVLEVGISNSFRNKLTEYFVKKETKLGSASINKIFKLLTVVYAITALVLISITALFPVEQYFLPANLMVEDFNFAFKISIVFYMLFFITSGLNTILLSTHHAKKTYFINALQSLVLLLGIYTFNIFEIEPSFTLIFLWFSATPFMIWLLANAAVFRTTLKDFAPDLKSVFSLKNYPTQNFNWGFFIMQLCTIVILSTDNLIIINTLSGTEVLKYNMAFKYFNILLIVFNLALVPYWATFTEATISSNKTWIQKHVTKLVKLWFFIFAGALGMLFLANFAYQLWIGKDLKIPNLLSLFMAISILLTAWNSIFAYFLNAISETKLQMYLLLFSAIINIPLSFFLISKFQTKGVIIATCIALLPLAIALPIQYKKILEKMT
jgi:O-antigen/teichoic acid export membrane protein